MADAASAAEKDPLEVAIEEIQLPPDAAIDEMLENEVGKVARESVVKAAAPSKPVDVAELDFVDRAKRSTVVALDHPFTLDGEKVESITVRRLTGFEIVEFARGHLDEAGGYDRYHLYAHMTGLPPAVLRGLDQDDGLAVTDACSRFLPRVLAEAS